MSVAQFDSRTHRYSYGGRILSSVTEILRFTGLYNDYTFAEDVHRFRGSAVHEACAKIDMGMKNVDVIAPDNAGQELRQVAEDCNLGYLPAFRAFKRATGFQGFVWECSWIDPVLGFGGTIDTIGMAGDEIWMPDLKSGEMPVLIPAQLGAYEHLLRNGISVGKIPEWLGKILAAKLPIKKKGLRLEKSGKWTLSEQTSKGRSYDDAYWGIVFRSALNVFNCRTEYGLTGLGYGATT